MINPNIHPAKNRFSPLNSWYTMVNDKNDTIEIEIVSVKTDKLYKHSLPNLWFKEGLTKKPIYNYLCLHTYHYHKTKDGYYKCTNDFNPTINKNTCKLNFDWVLEDTNENREKLLNEVYRLANE